MTASALPLKAGEQLASAVCTTRVVVVRAPAAGQHVLTCGGAAMVPASAAGKPGAATGAPAVTLIGKRYVNADGTVELLCTAAGPSELACDGVAMTIKAAKALPASD